MDVEQQQQGAQEGAQQNDQQGGEAGKVAKKFDGAVSKLMAMVRGNKTLFKKPKVAKDDLSSFVEDLLKDRREEALKNFKVQAIALIDKKVAFDKFMSEAKKRLEEEETKKKKEFTEEANKVFGLLDNADQMEKDYLSSLQTL